MHTSIALRVLLASIAVLCFGTVSPSPAQSPDGAAAPASSLARNAVYLELGGSSLLYSLNYSRRLGTRFVGRVGITRYPLVFGMPASASYLLGTGKWRPEVGIGLFAARKTSWPKLFREDERHGLLASAGPLAGFRYLPRESGVFFRIALQPLATMDRLDSDGVEVGVWGGISVGWAF